MTSGRLQCDLGPRVAGTHDEGAALPQLGRVPVFARVHVHDRRIELRREGRDPGVVKPARAHDHVVAMGSFQRPQVPSFALVRPRLLSHGAPLVRVKPKDIAAAGVERVPRVVGVRDGLPQLADERILKPANVIWCTGFRPDFSWIDLAVFGAEEEPREPTHERWIVAGEPGLYFVGLFFPCAMSSGLLPGVSRDAQHVVEAIACRRR